jgi:hypothetical protein
MKIIIFIICLIICFISCNEKQIEKKGKNELMQFSKFHDKKMINYYIDSININIIKEKGKNLYTSTFLSINDYIYYPLLKEKEYFGIYHLFYKDTINGIKCIGTMIISNSDIPWKYENKSDKLIELLIVDKNVVLFNNISVGNSVDILKSVFGNPILQKKDTIIFKLSENEYISAKSMNKKISAIKIGKYRTTLSDSLLFKKLSDFSY